MKMSDYFDLPVRPSQLEVYGANSNEGISFKEIEGAAAFAINNLDRLTEESAKLREALQSAMRIKDLWLPMHTAANEHEGEAIALHKMYNNFEQLLNQLEDQNNDK